MAVFLFSLLVFLALCPGDQGAEWSLGPKENDVINVCADGTLTLPWDLSLDPGDVIIDTQWFYSGRSEVLIATVVHDNFIIMPAYSGRVQQTGKAGVNIEQVQVLDSGNYTVEVVVRTAGGNVVTLRRSVNVLVTDGLQTTDGQLHVQQLPVAEYSNSTKQHHVVLTCGTFTYTTLPPFHATWFTPSGMPLNSSSYHDDRFRLLVPNPVEGGLYTCHLPASLTCVHGVSPQATHVLDKVEARLAVIEARQMEMESREQAMTLRQQETESREQAMTLRQNEMESREQAMTLRQQQMEMEMKLRQNETETREQKLELRQQEIESREQAMELRQNEMENELRKHVSFHARLSTTIHLPTRGTPLILPSVLNNQGDAYDATSGAFIAPYNGTYCFLATTRTASTNYYANFHLMVDDRDVGYLWTYRGSGNDYESGSVHAVVHVTRGQRVWLKSDGDSWYYSPTTSFSGFLISPDQ